MWQVYNGIRCVKTVIVYFGFIYLMSVWIISLYILLNVIVYNQIYYKIEICYIDFSLINIKYFDIQEKLIDLLYWVIVILVIGYLDVSYVVFKI